MTEIARPPLSRPYSNREIEGAEWHLRRRGFDRNTIKCAKGFNAPLWQSAIYHAKDSAPPSLSVSSQDRA